MPFLHNAKDSGMDKGECESGTWIVEVQENNCGVLVAVSRSLKCSISVQKPRPAIRPANIGRVIRRRLCRVEAEHRSSRYRVFLIGEIQPPIFLEIDERQ
jgi:hypothetical protein